MVFGPHIDATTQRLITSLVAGDVFHFKPEGLWNCEFLA